MHNGDFVQIVVCILVNNNKKESIRQLGLTHDQVQRLVLHAGVVSGPVKGGSGSPQAHDRGVQKRECNFASDECQCPAVGLVELGTGKSLECHSCRRTATAPGRKHDRREVAMLNFIDPLLVCPPL